MKTQHSSQKILITGGTGFAGSHLVQALLDTKQTNIHVTSLSGKNKFIGSLLPQENIHQLDLLDPAATQDLLKKLQPTQIYALASIAEVGKSFQKARKILQENTSLYLNLLEAVRDQTPDARILAVLSADGYKPSDKPIAENHRLSPLNPYGVSKVTQEMLCDSFAQAYDLSIVKVRPFNHIGPRQLPHFVVSAFAEQIVEIENGTQSELEVGNLTATRDFTDVRDTVLAYILLMKKGIPGEVYNVGSGTGYQIQEILDQLVGLSKLDISVKQDPSRMRPIDVPYMVADITKISQLGWSPTIPLKETLARIIEYWRNTL